MIIKFIKQYYFMHFVREKEGGGALKGLWLSLILV